MTPIANTDGALSPDEQEIMLDVINRSTGLTYVTDRNGILRSVSPQPWLEFFNQNDGRPGMAFHGLGRPLVDSVTGAQERDFTLRLHEGILRGNRDEVSLGFRCDSPEYERLFRMTVRRIGDTDNPIGVAYTTTPIRVVYTPTTPPPPEELEYLVTICSYCNDVRVGGGANDSDWVPFEDVSRLRDAQMKFSHGVCDSCADAFAMVIETKA